MNCARIHEINPRVSSKDSSAGAFGFRTVFPMVFGQRGAGTFLRSTSRSGRLPMTSAGSATMDFLAAACAKCFVAGPVLLVTINGETLAAARTLRRRRTSFPCRAASASFPVRGGAGRHRILFPAHDALQRHAELPARDFIPRGPRCWRAARKKIGDAGDDAGLVPANTNMVAYCFIRLRYLLQNVDLSSCARPQRTSGEPARSAASLQRKCAE